MPAYRKPIEKPDCPMCGRKATYEVYNGRNAIVGYYCATDAATVINRLNEAP